MRWSSSCVAGGCRAPSTPRSGGLCRPTCPRTTFRRAAQPDLELHARADCYRLTRTVAFVRAVAWDRTPDDPFASALGTFMLGANRTETSYQRLLRANRTG